MEHNELKTFIEVAKLESFSQAAEKLFLSQPAISKRIASLESKLNAKLFALFAFEIGISAFEEMLSGCQPTFYRWGLSPTRQVPLQQS